MHWLDGRSLDGFGIQASTLSKLSTSLLDELQVFTFECDRYALHLAIVQLHSKSVEVSVLADI